MLEQEVSVLAYPAFDHLERCTLGGWYIDSILSRAKERWLCFSASVRVG